MARAVSNAGRLVAALCVDGGGRHVAVRRGYSEAAAAALRKAEEKMVASTAKGKKTGGGSAEPPATTSAAVSSWVPDPVTGYYRPANRSTADVDAAELRRSLLPRKLHH